jgi:YidC/Oxa1 family membrane protein insertase
MPFWSELVDLVSVTLFGVSAALGGSMGLAISLVSLAIRLALLPLTLRLAYRALEMQAALKKIAPALARVRERHKADPQKMLEETARLYRQNGIKLVDGGTFLGTIVQAPVFFGLLGAIRRGIAAGGRFLWIEDLGQPDALLAVVCALVTASTAALAPAASETTSRAPMILVPAVLTLVFLARLAAGLSLYTLASGLVGVLQAVLVRRRAARLLAA